MPVGFAQGIVTLNTGSEIDYKSKDYYAPQAEGSIRSVSYTHLRAWPLAEQLILNERDAIAPLLTDFKSPFTLGENS